MGKLYYITGNGGQLREKVCCEILKWSQAEQMNPLQSYPRPKGEEPNFYLYDYLGQGSKEQLVQLTEQYGEDHVEPIYLRSANETEAALLAQGIYQSYDPYENLAQCLQEMAETVFTGYQKTAYSFAAALQAEKEQAQAAEKAKEEATLLQEKKQKKKAFFKKVVQPIVVIAVWMLIVCLITMAIFQGATKETTSGNKGGNLITVIRPENTSEIGGNAS